MLIFLLHPAIILIPTVISFTTGNAQAIVGEQVTAMGFTQTLYEYTSAAANNGSDYFGTSADTPFWNWSTAIVMFLGRYVPLGLMLAIAGSFTIKDRKEVIEPIKTKGPLFISILVVMTFLLTALSFFPFLIMGPISYLNKKGDKKWKIIKIKKNDNNNNNNKKMEIIKHFLIN